MKRGRIHPVKIGCPGYCTKQDLMVRFRFCISFA